MNLTTNLWNKKTAINGVNAEVVLSKHPEFQTGDVFTVTNAYGQLIGIESVNTIKSILQLDPSTSSEETMKQYIEYRKEA